MAQPTQTAEHERLDFFRFDRRIRSRRGTEETQPIARSAVVRRTGEAKVNHRVRADLIRRQFREARIPELRRDLLQAHPLLESIAGARAETLRRCSTRPSGPHAPW